MAPQDIVSTTPVEQQHDVEAQVETKSPAMLKESVKASKMEGKVAAEEGRRSPTTPRIRTHDFNFLPIPPNLRYDPTNSFTFSFGLNLFFGFVSTFQVANLYYCQPLLVNYSDTFGKSHSVVSNIPTLTQAGYATGLIFISPLGDLVRRRPLLLILGVVSTAITVGLALVKNFEGFEVFSFFIGMASVTPQVLIPLAADLAPPKRRASAISIVLSGLLLGLLIARVLAGIVANYVSWRNVYWMAFAVQALNLVLLVFFLPDYPSNFSKHGLSYFGILTSMCKFMVTEPVLVQACLIGCVSSAVFTNFWVTLTFLLDGPPYNYNVIEIGLFGLAGMAGVLCAPFTGKLIDRLVPWVGTLIGQCLMLTSQVIHLGAAGINVAAVIIVCVGLDLGQQTQQISNQTRIYPLDPSAKSRLNSLYIFSIFLGQVMGSSVGSEVFTSHGWRPASALSVGWLGFNILVLLLRGPMMNTRTLIGWKGKWALRKRTQERMEEEEEEKEKEGNRDVRKPNDNQEGEIEKGVNGAKESFGLAETPEKRQEEYEVLEEKQNIKDEEIGVGQEVEEKDEKIQEYREEKN